MYCGTAGALTKFSEDLAEILFVFDVISMFQDLPLHFWEPLGPFPVKGLRRSCAAAPALSVAVPARPRRPSAGVNPAASLFTPSRDQDCAGAWEQLR